jgi:hypothetical protein
VSKIYKNSLKQRSIDSYFKKQWRDAKLWHVWIGRRLAFVF